MAAGSIWIDTIVNHLIGTSTQLVIELSFVPDRFARNDLTLVRTIVCLDFAADLDDSPGIMLVDYAIGNTSVEALEAAPVAAGSIPDPRVADERPIRGWVYRCGRMVVNRIAGEPIVTSDQKDIRAKRVMGNGVSYFTAGQTVIDGTAFLCNVGGIIRQLYSYK